MNGRSIVLFNIEGTVHAIDNSCPHNGASLASGKLEGGVGGELPQVSLYSLDALEDLVCAQSAVRGRSCKGVLLDEGQQRVEGVGQVDTSSTCLKTILSFDAGTPRRDSSVNVAIVSCCCFSAGTVGMTN